jgi:hypothetical protein
MKKLLAVLLIFVMSTATASSQTKVVHFKKIQECLPTKELKGFKRMKPGGSTQTAFGMTTSEATVRYQQAVSESPGGMRGEIPPVTDPYGSESEATASIEVKVSDVTGVPFAAMAFAVDRGDFENEREDGYEKSTVVKGKYKGIEEVSHGEGYKSCKLSFSVANRFTVELNASGTDDVKLLQALVESMNLDKLEKLTP